MSIPRQRRLGNVIGTMTVSQHGVPIGHIKFTLTVTASAEADQEPPGLSISTVGEDAKRYEVGFVSDASEDRMKALKRSKHELPPLEKAVPDEEAPTDVGALAWIPYVRPASVLPSAPNSPSWADPMERLRAIGDAISRSVTAGHWPGQGPTDEHLTQIADNLSHAQRQVERSRRASQTPTDSPADLQHAPGQVTHTLYVAAHGTVVALRAYAADLQGQAETAKRRRQPVTERPPFPWRWQRPRSQL